MPVPAGGDDALPTTPPAGAYAAQADLDGVIDPIPANADQLLVRASRAIDRALLTSRYDPEDAAVIAALRAATVEQVAGTLAGGDRGGLGVTSTPASFAIGRINVTGASSGSTAPTTGGLVDQAWSILQSAGLTGHPVEETWGRW